MEERNWVAEATVEGWTPDKENLPEGKEWKDAETFVRYREKRSEHLVGKNKTLEGKNDRLEERIDILESSNQAIVEANKEFGAYKEGQLNRERQRSAELLAELEGKRATAITDADGAEFNRLDREIDAVKQELTPPAKPNGEGDVMFQAWVINNGWYNTNPKLRRNADAIADEVVKKGFAGGSPAYYEEINRQMKVDFPEVFGKRPERANDVEPGGELERRDSNDHSYDNLPADAKAACDRFVTAGHTTKESYLANYDWE